MLDRISDFFSGLFSSCSCTRNNAVQLSLCKLETSSPQAYNYSEKDSGNHSEENYNFAINDYVAPVTDGTTLR